MLLYQIYLYSANRAWVDFFTGKVNLELYIQLIFLLFWWLCSCKIALYTTWVVYVLQVALPFCWLEYLDYVHPDGDE